MNNKEMQEKIQRIEQLKQKIPKLKQTIQKHKVILLLSLIITSFLSYKLNTSTSLDFEGKLVSGSIVVIMQIMLINFYVKRYFFVAGVLLLLSMTASICFFYNQTNTFLELQMKNNKAIVEKKEANSFIEKLLESSSGSSQALGSEYDEDIKAKEAEIEGFEKDIEDEKQKALDRYDSWLKKNKSWAGTFQKEEAKEKFNVARDKSIIDIKKEISSVKDEISDLRKEKREDSKRLMNETKEIASNYQRIDIKEEMNKTSFSNGYIGVFQELGIAIGIRFQLLLLFLMIITGVFFDICIIRWHKIVIRLEEEFEALQDELSELIEETGYVDLSIEENNFENIKNMASSMANTVVSKVKTINPKNLFKKTVKAEMKTAKQNNTTTETGTCEIREYDKEIPESEVKKTNTIGFKTEEIKKNVSIKNDNITKYLEVLLQNLKADNTTSIGIRKISDKAGMEFKDGKVCHESLKKVHEVIETDHHKFSGVYVHVEEAKELLKNLKS